MKLDLIEKKSILHTHITMFTGNIHKKTKKKCKVWTVKEI